MLFWTCLQKLWAFGEFGLQAEIPIDRDCEFLDFGYGVECRKNMQQWGSLLEFTFTDLIIDIIHKALAELQIRDLMLTLTCLHTIYYLWKSCKFAVEFSLLMLPGELQTTFVIHLIILLLLCVILLCNHFPTKLHILFTNLILIAVHLLNNIMLFLLL